MKKKRRMRPGGGAAKGGAYERKLARDLSAWWYAGDANYLWRRPGSGYRARMPNRHTGDIVPMADVIPPDKWPFHIEAKCYAKSRLKLDNILWPDRNPIRKIWVKAFNERRKDLVPLLILKANRTDPVGVMRESDGDDLMECLGIESSFLSWLSSYVVMTKGYKRRVIVFPWLEIQKEKRPAKRNF